MKPFFRLITGHIERATKHSAAFDLFYNGIEPLWVADTPIAIPTGVTTEFSPGYVAIIKEKSGLAVKGLEVKAGVIDADYRDEWKVVMRNPVQLACDLSGEMLPMNWKPFSFNPGDKIAQFIITKLPRELLYKAEEGALLVTTDSKRKGGFGSTDRKPAT